MQDKENERKNLINGDLLGANMRQLELLNIVMYLTGGIIAGILGLTGTNGLILFVAMSIVVQVAVLLRMGFKTDKFLVVSFLNMSFSAASSQCLTYILFWTLAFALVHIY
jgi:hypothetical protein